MGRRLLSGGAILLVATVALWVAGAVDWLGPDMADRWSSLTTRGALVLLAAAVLARLGSMVGSLRAAGRCEVCGRRTERGHMYCLDHLRETVNVTRDQARDQKIPRTKPLPQPRT